MAGITENGFEKKSYSEIVTEMENKTIDIFGENIDLQDGTFQKQFIDALALRFSVLWDKAEDLYNSMSINNASDITLDYACKYQGIQRRSAQKSIVTITFSGDDGTIIPTDFIIETENSIQFKTTESGELSSGSVDLSCEALIAGVEGNVAAGTITNIVNPIVGLDSITNSSDATGGLEKEPDDSLRNRYFESLASGGGSTADAIRAVVLNLDNVRDVIVKDNETESTVDGIPPHAFETYVLGGADLDIHDAIYQNKPLGIKAHGDISKQYIDDSGNDITIEFSRPTTIDIYINLVMSTNEYYPDNGDQLVLDITENHINNLDISQNVVLFELSTQIGSQVPGITNLTIETSTDGTNYSSADVTINELEIAETDSGKLAIV